MKRSHALVILAAGWTLVIPLLSLLPPSFFSAAGHFGRLPYMDKVVHAGIYGVQTVLLIAAWRSWSRIVGFRLFAIPAFSASAYGLLMEVLQRTLTECREFSWGDVAGNAIGAVTAALVMGWLTAAGRSGADSSAI